MKKFRKILEDLKKDEISVESALEKMAELPFVELDYAKLDTHRSLRTGLPEAIYCPGKTPEQVAILAETIFHSGETVIATRAGNEHYVEVKKRVPDATYAEKCGLITANEKPSNGFATVNVVAAGTSDIPVSEEAAFTARALGCRVNTLTDVGIAGAHRALANMSALREAGVNIVVAGMEGALASFVSGLVATPVIAVPASTGYGASFGGLTALLGMLSSCSPGIATVGIDNGFGAACLAYKILNIEKNR